MPTGTRVIPGGGAKGAAELGEMRPHGDSRITAEGGGTEQRFDLVEVLLDFFRDLGRC
jgi:hypothetical protein